MCTTKTLPLKRYRYYSLAQDLGDPGLGPNLGAAVLQECWGRGTVLDRCKSGASSKSRCKSNAPFSSSRSQN